MHAFYADPEMDQAKKTLGVDSEKALLFTFKIDSAYERFSD
jgi:hypothetical protein